MTYKMENIERMNALTIYNEKIRAQVRDSSKLDDLYVGDPKLIVPYQPYPNNKEYWRVPILSNKYSRVIGHFDVRNLDDHPELLRFNKLSRHPVNSETEAPEMKTDILELSEDDIYNQIKTTCGKDVEIASSPQLVFDHSESRVAWRVDFKRGDKILIAFVTPGYAYIDERAENTGFE